MVALVSLPVDTPPSLGSLANTRLCGLNERHGHVHGHGTYTAEGITKLCEGLKGSAVTSLKCAASRECSLFFQRPSTSSLSHHPCSAPHPQSPRQLHRRRWRLRARCRPQRDENLPAQVRRRLRSQCSLLCQPPLTLLITCLLTRARSLDRNDFGPVGGVYLAEGLKGNSTLHVLE